MFHLPSEDGPSPGTLGLGDQASILHLVVYMSTVGVHTLPQKEWSGEEDQVVHDYRTHDREVRAAITKNVYRLVGASTTKATQ